MLPSQKYLQNAHLCSDASVLTATSSRILARAQHLMIEQVLPEATVLPDQMVMHHYAATAPLENQECMIPESHKQRWICNRVMPPPVLTPMYIITPCPFNYLEDTLSLILAFSVNNDPRLETLYNIALSIRHYPDSNSAQALDNAKVRLQAAPPRETVFLSFDYDHSLVSVACYISTP